MLISRLVAKCSTFALLDKKVSGTSFIFQYKDCLHAYVDGSQELFRFVSNEVVSENC